MRATRSAQREPGRAIETIVRTQLLLTLTVLVSIAAVLVGRGGAASWVGLLVVIAGLGVLAVVVRRMPLRPLLALGQLLLLIAAGGVFVAIGLLPHLGLYRPVTVLSGSMRPTFNPGDLIIVRPEPLPQVRVGQVISYSVPVGAHQVETHRVIRIIKGGPNPVVQTQGDANNWKDPWVAQLHGTTAWRLAAVIPYAGYAISAMRSRTMHTLSIIVVPILLALIVLAQLWGIGPRRKETSNARA
jgi:signal peptidase